MTTAPELMRFSERNSSDRSAVLTIYNEAKYVSINWRPPMVSKFRKYDKFVKSEW